MQKLNRVDRLALPAAAYKTYGISSPRATHWRPAACAQAQCRGHREGWQSTVPSDSPQADYIRHDKSRRHVETRPAPGWSHFTFEPGQECFTWCQEKTCPYREPHHHHILIDRQERFLVRGGDWRGNPDGFRREHKRPEDWQDDFASHQDKIATLVSRG